MRGFRNERTRVDFQIVSDKARELFDVWEYSRRIRVCTGAADVARFERVVQGEHFANEGDESFGRDGEPDRAE